MSERLAFSKGVTRGTSKGHFARATLEGIAFQVMDVLKSMEADSGLEVKELRVDGGAAANKLLLQFQWAKDIIFTPDKSPEEMSKSIHKWKKALERAKGWMDDDE